jgi:hypothetical protein
MKKAPSIVHNIISKHRHLHITSLHLARYNGTLPAPSDPFQLKHNNMTTPASSNTRPVPEGFSPHTERNATILLPVQDKPFLNPIQEYNRDLSVASGIRERRGGTRTRARASRWKLGRKVRPRSSMLLVSCSCSFGNFPRARVREAVERSSTHHLLQNMRSFDSITL